MRPLFLIGAGGLAREVLSTVQAGAGQQVSGIIDDEPSLRGTSVEDVPVLGPLDVLRGRDDVDLVVCAGRGAVRELIVQRLARLGIAATQFVNVVDVSARIGDSCTLGPGTIVLANAVLTCDVTIGRHVVVMPNVTITHDDVVEDFATLCAGVALGGAVRVGAGAYVGMNAGVRERVCIGAGAVIGMGSVVLQDVPPSQTWVGVPARPLSVGIR